VIAAAITVEGIEVVLISFVFILEREDYIF
jgi:hypothetical protein